jgi:hypothetical protein
MNNKPFIIEVEESKNELVQCVNHIVNEKGVPCYFILPTLENLTQQVRAVANNELKMAMEQTKEQNKEV